MDANVIQEFENEVKKVETAAAVAFEMGEADLKLDTRSREPDVARVAKHIHQTCVLHATNFRRANYVKVAYIGRFFLTEAAAKNPIGVTSAARVLVEVDAFLRWVSAELAKSADGPSQEWRSRGQTFFDTMIRARFASSNPTIIEVLTKAGVPDKLRRPVRVGECVKSLATRPGLDWVHGHYEFLCDWVHANQSSQTASSSNLRHGDTIKTSGATLLVPGGTMILTHQYGSLTGIDYVLKQTLERAHVGFIDAIDALRHMPDTPFREDEVMRLTGTPTGGGGLPRGSRN